jgi:hypothetical protein
MGNAMRDLRRRLRAGVLSTLVLGFAKVAGADERQQCINASEKAQQLKNAGRLSDARGELAVCGRESCPKLIQQDCSAWMKEVLEMLPSVVPGAKDKSGRDIVDVKISVDGKVVAERIDGKALAVDPGVHTFRFETKGAPSLVERVVVRQGEKNRILTVTFASGTEPVTTPVKSPPIVAYVLGGLGLATLGAALYVDLDANSDARELRETCAPRCEQSRVDDIEDRYVIAGVTAGVGGALLIGGVVLFVLHATSDPKSGKPSILPSTSPMTGGAGGATLRF